MKSKYIKVLFKPKKEMTLWENALWLEFLCSCSSQEFKFAASVRYNLKLD